MPDQRRGQLILASAFRRFIKAISSVRGARRAAEVLRGENTAALEREADAAVGILERLPMLREVPGGPEGVIAAMGGRREVARGILEHQTVSLSAAIDSASLIFVHAAVDDAILQYLSAIASASPEVLSARVSGRKVELGSLENKDYEQLLDEKLSDYLDELERRSLPDKVGVLLGVLRPEENELRGEQYEFEMERLADLDQLRHDVVHRSGPRPVPRIEQDIAYMEFVALTFWALTSLKLPQTFDPALMTGPIPEIGT